MIGKSSSLVDKCHVCDMDVKVSCRMSGHPLSDIP